MNHIEASKHGSFYEVFIHRAFKSSDTSKPGTHGSVIENIARVENGNTSFVKWQGTLSKQLSNAKGYMQKAMDKYLKMKSISIENRSRLEVLKKAIDQAKSSEDLMVIVYESLDLTQIAKDY